MGLCLQVTHTLKQNITGSAFESLTAASGDSLNIPDFDQGTDAFLVDVWGGISAHAGEFGLRSPNFHDNIRGLRMAYDFNPTLSGADGNPQFLTGEHVKQRLYPTDTLTAEVNGTATDNVGMGYLSFYRSLDGSDMQLRTWGEIEPRIKNTLAIRVSCTAGATGDYGTALNFTSSDDRLIANRQYALIGATSQLPATTIALMGPETSNRFLGCPLHWDARWSGDYFARISRLHSIPSIVEFSGSNKAQWQIKVADAATNIATAATIHLLELK